ncbi:LAFE_0F04940g1_1 [Lachancea fermentati]|uniref:LAFE_0F04940g1_1 n=1 Tax=Lachancea fermentati TaxID=4955 RepID=A0A1G4MEN9_LACFM|nr:LAFE_0F04940g1_1 [Lachancea fermentati]
MPSIVEKSVFGSGGKTIIALSSDGKYLCATNKNGMTKILQLESPEEEPDVLETCKNPTSMVLTSPSSCIISTLKGDVHSYDTDEEKYRLLLRSALPVRDCILVHGGKTLAVGGDDLKLSLIELDGDRKRTSVDVSDQVSQLSYNPQMSILAVSLVNGSIHFFSMTSARPNEVHVLSKYTVSHFYNDDFLDHLPSVAPSQSTNEVDGVKDLEYCVDNRLSTRVEWHPYGMQFAVPGEDSSVKIFNLKDYSLIKSLKPAGTTTHITAVKFSPKTGEYIAVIDLNNKLTIWNVQTSEIHFTKELSFKITNICWKLHQNDSLDLILGTWTGDVIFIPAVSIISQQSTIDDLGNQKEAAQSLFVDSDDDAISPKVTDLGETGERRYSSNSQDLFTDNEEEGKKRKLFHYDDEEDFIDDDDGAGYVSVKQHKSNASNPLPQYGFPSHRKPQFSYKPFSPGATPFGIGDRRYLTMNNVGYAWTVRNGSSSSSSHNTITVSFFDLGRFKEYHFEDLFGYDICSLTDDGSLFAQSKMGQIHYRPHNGFHSTWTKKIPLQKSECITSVAATPRRVIVGTSHGYVRIFNQFGVPLALEKMSPIVAIAAQDYRIFAVHFSPLQGLSYSLFEQNPRSTHNYYQRESSLPLTMPENNGNVKDVHHNFSSFNPLGIKSIFFSAYGDPCIFGSDDVLLVLSKWRFPAQSTWVPLLDARFEIWKMSGGNESNDLHVWPLGLTYDTLNHILVKGKNMWPEFPMPLPSEMEIRIPLLAKDQIDVSDESESNEVVIPTNIAAEEEFLRSKILAQLLNDTLSHDGELYGNEHDILLSLAGAHDKSLLRLFAIACSDQNNDKAVSIVQELKQDKALNAAAKIAERAELTSLVKKIDNIREARFEQQLNGA